MNYGFDPADGLVLVSARVWGPEADTFARLALDTGASTTMISSAVLFSLGYDVAAATERVRMTTGSGVEYVPRLGVSRIEALGKSRMDMAIVCHTLPPSASVDGLLGLDFFRGHRLTLDFLAGEITLE